MDSMVTMRGNVGSPVSFKCGDSSDGRKWSRAEFRLGSTRRLRRPDGEWADAGTTWISVEAWAALAEGVRGSLEKGDPVLVSGRLRTDEWADDNGQVQSRLVLAAEAIGHDLSRGRTRFVKNAPIPLPDASAGVADADADDEPTGAANQATRGAARPDPLAGELAAAGVE